MSQIMGRPDGTGSAARPDGPVYGAIDLGTNNCRLLLAEPSGPVFRVVGGFSRIVRLGEGLSATGRLGDAAMHRTLEALDICASRARHLNAGKMRCVATEACRRAENGAEFLHRVERQTGLVFDIISPETEAGLTVSGCLPLFAETREKTLLFDIGGGSTEIIWIETPRRQILQIRGLLSFPAGVVTLAEDYGIGDYGTGDDNGTVDNKVRQQIKDSISAHLKPFCERDAIRANDVQMLGTSGTVTTLGAVYLGLPRYDRERVDGLTIPGDSIRALSAKLVRMDAESRRQIPCIGPDRAGLMLMGCAILDAIRERWPVATLRAADRGIREGLLQAMIDEDRALHRAPDAAPDGIGQGVRP